MLTGDYIKKSLLKEAGQVIYKRGKNYYLYSRVETILIEKNSNNTISISGKVNGAKLYSTSLVFDVSKRNFSDLQCSCPYSYTCKHIVALGLYLANYIDNPNYKPAKISDYTVLESKQEQSPSEIAENDVRSALAKLGLPADKLPQNLISKLLNFQKAENLANKKNTRQQNNSSLSKSKKFYPSNYYIVLDDLEDFKLDIYEKNSFYHSDLTGHILDNYNLNPAQKKIIKYIAEDKYSYLKMRTKNITKLLKTLSESEIPVYDDYYLHEINHPMKIDFEPKPLSTEIVYETEKLYTRKNATKNNFIIRLDEKYRDEFAEQRNPFILQDENLIYSSNKKIEIYKLTPLLAKLMDRIHYNYNYNINSFATYFYYQAKLNIQEIKQYPKLIEEASQFLDLISPPPQFSVNYSDKAQKCFLVNFDNTEQSLEIKAVVDYGGYKQNISDSIYWGKSGRAVILKHRELPQQVDDHLVIVKDNVIHCSPLQADTEIDFYQELTEIAPSLGFSKSLKCKQAGKQLQDYLQDYWPNLKAYSKEKNYPLIFEKDKLITKKAIFTAEFKTDIKADNDWLYFDIEIYYGDKKISLEDLLNFLESNQLYWQQDNGKMLEVSNRKELEHLAKMLKSFQARENGGFEGKLRNAPELEYIMTSSPHYNAVREKSFSQFIKHVQSGKPLKNIKLPDKLSKILRPYQKEGINWLYFLRSYHFAGVLADDMGLGKTLQTLSVLHKERIKAKPSMVVCPKTLLYNWKLEAKKFFPRMKVMVYDGTISERLEKQKDLKNFDLIVLGYNTLRNDEDFFTKVDNKFNYVVLDEAQFIKNHKTKNAQMVKKINADYRLALTGTPLENSVSELWSIYDFLMPNFLGNYNQFNKNFHGPIMNQNDSQALEHLRKKVGGFMLRRVKSEVLKELPPKIEQISQCHLSQEQNILYQQVLSQVKGQVFSAVSSKGFKGAQIHILAGLTKLRQVCNHPALLLKDKDFKKYQSAKLEMCLELVNEIKKSQRKVLIFSQFTKMLDIVSAELKDSDIKHLYLSGKTNNRQDLVDKFNHDSSITVFLISLKAGGTGLNLTSADNVIIFDPWWNPSVENQAIDRTHRIGQNRNVNVYRLLSSGTIEEKIQNLKQKKQNLFNALVSTSGDKFNKLSWEDVRELFS